MEIREVEAYIFVVLYSILNFTSSLSIYFPDMLQRKVVLLLSARGSEVDKDCILSSNTTSLCTNVPGNNISNTLSINATTTTTTVNDSLDKEFLEQEFYTIEKYSNYTFFAGAILAYILIMYMDTLKNRKYITGFLSLFAAGIYGLLFLLSNMSLLFAIIYTVSTMDVSFFFYIFMRTGLGACMSIHIFLYNSQVFDYYRNNERKDYFISIAGALSTISGSLSIMCAPFLSSLCSSASCWTIRAVLCVQCVIVICILCIITMLSNLKKDREKILYEISASEEGVNNVSNTENEATPSITEKIHRKTWIFIILWPLFFFMSGINAIIFTRNSFFGTYINSKSYYFFMSSPLIGSCIFIIAQKCVSSFKTLHIGAAACAILHFTLITATSVTQKHYELFIPIILWGISVFVNFAFSSIVMQMPALIGGQFEQPKARAAFYLSTQIINLIITLCFPFVFSVLNYFSFSFFLMAMLAGQYLIYWTKKEVKRNRCKKKRNGGEDTEEDPNEESVRLNDIILTSKEKE